VVVKWHRGGYFWRLRISSESSTLRAWIPKRENFGID
jgi:hypothetical protein